MAKGRMLNRSISMSLKFNSLPDDTARLIATWIIPYLDARGVFYADPLIIKGTVIPMRTDITLDTVQRCLDAMESAELIKRFFNGGRVWQYWPGFTDNQAGLRPEREGRPEYPEYVQPPETITPAPAPATPIVTDTPKGDDYDNRSYSGVTPQLLESPAAEEKRREEKRKEVEGKGREENARAILERSKIRNPLYDAIAEACTLDPALCGDEILAATNKLHDFGATPEHVKKFIVWWNVEDFRGTRGDPPTTKQMLQRWKDGMAGKKHNTTLSQAHDYRPKPKGNTFSNVLIEMGEKGELT